ncbi:MAG: DUF3316 domain-containing protein [Prevotella sp.]|nr:DUF3316 domain-containing protein [Prevotella sp.]
MVVYVAISSQLPLPANAQATTPAEALQGQLIDPLPIREKATMIAVGSTNILDTYLSPESYKGEEIHFISTVHKPTRWNNIWQTVVNEGSIATVNNRADNNDEIGGAYDFQYHLRHHWEHGNFNFEVGAAIGAHLGFLYNTRNSNNPAQAYAAINLMPSAALSRSLTLFKRSSALHYELTVPLLGLMFSPNYGQSYYEIFSRGNYDHNIVPTTIGATPSLRHSLTLDIPLSRQKPTLLFRIGYLGDYQQAKVNNLKQHHYAHLLLIGWTKYF